MDKLWKWSVRLGAFFLFPCLAGMLWFSANKPLAVGEGQEGEDEVSPEERIEEILEKKESYAFTVAVNPAHGGSDLGNAANGCQEKEITLGVALFLEELAAESDIGVFLTRRDDSDISSGSRYELINRAEPDLVIDIHVNANPENERLFGTEIAYNGEFYRPGMNNAKLADLMERELVTVIEGKANGIYSDNGGKYPLLGMVQLPMVSVELGYLTNPEEAALLNKETYQEKIAQGLYQGIHRVRKELDKA